MKVYVRNKFFSFGGASNVVDESNNPVYKVKGKVFSVTRKKTLCDMEGNVLYKIRNKWFNWFIHKAYIYDANKNKIATVKDKWFNVNQEYFILGYKDEIKIEGKFFSFSAQILRNGEVIGTIRREAFRLTDCFELEADEKDIPFLIALVVAIDNITDKKHK